jgi:rubrerythrin
VAQRPEVNDLRVLKLAELYEEAYERFVVEVATRVVEDPEVQGLLRRLVAPEDRHHERIAAQIERLRGSLAREDRDGIARAALLDVVDVERSARDFYLRQADYVHDPEVGSLFRALAREEAAHHGIALQALELATRKHVAGAPDLSRAFRLLGEPGEGLPLREGVSDFCVHHEPPRRAPRR